MPTNSGYDPTQPIGAPYGFVGPATLPGTPTSPINSGPQSPFGTSPLGVSPFTSAQQSQIQSAFDAAGLGGWIENLGSDVWNVISKILPKNADGSIDWAGALKDVGSWVKDNKDTILQGLSAYNNYERSQKSDAYAQQALAGAKESYDAKAPLRVAGQAGMLNPQGADLSGLKTQGQSGLSLSAPKPLPLATGNLGNAQAMANGPSSSNPFTRTLPVATPQAPPTAPTIPLGPSNVPPIGGMTPPSMPPTPNGFTPPTMPPGAPQLPGVPGAPTAPQPLPIERKPQTGQIRMPGYQGNSPRSVSY